MYKVSVIIPAYNVENYIKRCLESVLNQTLNQIEIIIVNDGSKDETLKVINPFKDNRLKIIDKENGGVSSARNAGLSIAKGEYIFFLDGDDWLEKDALGIMYQYAIDNSLDIVISGFILDYDNGQKEYITDGNKLSNKPISDVLLNNIAPAVWSKLYNTKLLVENNVFFTSDISLGEDLLFNIKAFSLTSKIGTINEKYFVHYIQRNNGLTRRYSNNILDIFKVLEEIELYLSSTNIVQEYKKELVFCGFLHTYFYRIMVPNIYFQKFHKIIYQLGKENFYKYDNNLYVENFCKMLPTDKKLRIKGYEINYYLGSTLSMMTRYNKFLLKVFFA
ncbi:hypothetical protein BED47_22955, partial [Gottfriedia luciferensis]